MPLDFGTHVNYNDLRIERVQNAEQSGIKEVKSMISGRKVFARGRNEVTLRRITNDSFW